jgi:hypothetical protein
MTVEDTDTDTDVDDVDTDKVEDKPEAKDDAPKLTKAEWQAKFDAEVLPKRLQRKEKEVLKALGLNSVDEYATIAEKAKNYDGLVEKDKTEEQRRAERDAERDREFAELKRGLAERDHKLLVGEVADELNVPKRLRKFLTGTDEDSLREQAQELLDGVSEVAGKKDTKQKTPDDSVKETKTVYGGGGKKPDKTINTTDLAASILKKQAGVLAR